jgi:hypothetical protein
MPTISTSNRTTNSVVLNGSGFLPELQSCPPQAVTIYDDQNNTLAASYLAGNSALGGSSWQLTLTGITAAGFFARYVIDAEENPGCYELSFYITPFATVTTKPFRYTTESFSKAGSYLKIRSPSRRNFPSI